MNALIRKSPMTPIRAGLVPVLLLLFACGGTQAPQRPARSDACTWLSQATLQSVTGVAVTAVEPGEVKGGLAGQCRWKLARPQPGDPRERREPLPAVIVLMVTSAASLREETGISVGIERWYETSVRETQREALDEGVWTEPEPVAGIGTAAHYSGPRQPSAQTEHSLSVQDQGWMAEISLFGGSRAEIEAIARAVVERMRKP